MKTTERNIRKLIALICAFSLLGLSACKKKPETYEEKIEQQREELDQLTTKAQFQLGLVYYKGVGRPKDKKKALYWFKQSAEQGNQMAQSLLKKIEEEAMNTVRTVVKITNNSVLPIYPNKETVFYKLSLNEKTKEVTYHYKLLNIDVKDIDSNQIPTLKKEEKEEMLKRAVGNPKNEAFILAGVTLISEYTDKNGKLILRVALTAKEIEKQEENFGDFLALQL